jgi:hypothetical protein
MRSSAWGALAGVVLLAGCGGGDKAAKPKAEDDPAVTGALGDEIMVDPELAGQNGNDGGSAIELPPEQRTPEAVAAAKAEALRLAGGTIQPAPPPVEGDVSKLIENTATAAQIAAVAGGGKVDCANKVEYSAKWANALPAALTVYPQAAVQEAAGTDAGGCKLRVVSFLTPVPASEVIDFYYTRARSGGYDAKHHVAGQDHVLGGGKAGASYLVYARGLDNGLSEVDVVASGG